ncbi:MAG: phospholipase D family protein [Eubacterium sp.]|nr:phospholipase D family protein [Eubacterium sp.]
MNILIQDPTYSSSMRLGEALLDACNMGKDGAGAFAFVEENGVDLFLGDPDFDKYISKHNYVLVVGTDSITDPKAIASLRAYQKKYKKLTVFAYVHDARKYLFHPKITWFESTTGGLSLIGSGNLTERGLYHNVEIYGRSDLSKTDFDDMKKKWDDWFDWCLSNNLLFSIDDPIVDYAVNLSAVKKARSFSSGKKSGRGKGGSIDPNLIDLYKKQPKVTSVKRPAPSKGTGKTTKPTTPKPASTIISRPIPKVAPVVVTPTASPVWSIDDDDRALVAEVPRSGNRWKQVNFDKATFEEYFGAIAGGAGGTYRILLKGVDSTGTMSKTEPRPSVSVASHNYRFEIDAASGLPYPTGGARPYIVFVEVSTRSFLYELLMPGTAAYSEVDKYVKSWKSSNGNPQIARISTTAKDIKGAAPNLGLWKI